MRKAVIRWQVRLSAAAEADVDQILRWTLNEFGTVQMRRYSRTLGSAVAALSRGPKVPGARTRDEIASGLRTLHVTHGSRRGRHLILFRVADETDAHVIEVLRVLHDAMDLPRHTSPDDHQDSG